MGWEVRKSMKKSGVTRPILGSNVRLKTLEQICRLHGVRHWEDVREPEVADQMVHLFGHKVLVTNTVSYSRQFQARDLGNGNTWYFRNDWIDNETDRFKIGSLPDELFEI